MTDEKSPDIGEYLEEMKSGMAMAESRLSESITELKRATSNLDNVIAHIDKILEKKRLDKKEKSELKEWMRLQLRWATMVQRANQAILKDIKERDFCLEEIKRINREMK